MKEFIRSMSTKSMTAKRKNQSIPISFIIPTLNEERFLPTLLHSLAQQTDRHFEVIVVDGQSTDRTVAVARKFAHDIPTLTVVECDRASLPYQRNTGAKHARYDWLAFVDADSILLPNFLDRVSVFVNTMKPKVFTAWCRPDTEHISDAVFTLLGNIMIELAIKFRRPLAPGPLTLIHRSVFDKIGGYDEQHAFHEDMDLSLRLLKEGITLMTLKETLYVLSLRRFRQQGTLKVMQQYILAVLPVMFFGKTFRFMPGYIMGGQLYTRKKQGIPPMKLKNLTMQVKRILDEFIE